MRFRSLNVALTADIEKAFLMISVAEHDRDVLGVDDLAKDPPDIRDSCFRSLIQPIFVDNQEPLGAVLRFMSLHHSTFTLKQRKSWRI